MALVESFSGIRGIYGTELTDEIVSRYGKAYYDFLMNKGKKEIKIVIGRDTRPSGESVFHNLIKGIDCEIIDVGISPTPVIENAVRSFGCDGGIIITASHNEPEFNGFKFLDTDGSVLNAEESEDVINRCHKISLEVYKVKSQKIINKEREAMVEYKKFCRDIVKEQDLSSSLKILVDPNGGSGIVSREIYGDYGINAEYINMDIMKFNRLVEPNETSLKYLKETINKNKCDFAVGFDCDADRVEILLPDGNLVSGNQILALIAKEILSHSSGKKSIVVNDATSYLVKDISDEHDADWIEVEVGEANVVNEMIKRGSQIAGEGSNGGVIIPPSRCRDGILTVLILLKLLKEKKESLKKMIEELPRYFYIKEKIKLKEDFWNIRDKIKGYYVKNGFKILETGDETGGLKAIKNGSWVWFRQSKTEDKALRIISDSKDKENAEALIKEAKTLIV